ncbi:MAG: Eco57I restriction-modification methylase domain-containing protein [Gemmatimonadales bacterium]
MLWETLRGIARFEDLPRLIGALGFTPDWRELPDRCLGPAKAVIVGRQGEFGWYAVASGEPAIVVRAARTLAARGLPAAVLGLEPSVRRLHLATGDAPLLVLDLDAPRPLDRARLERCVARPGELAWATGFRIGEALATRGVDDRFFAKFRQTLGTLIAALPGRIPPADRHALGLLCLTRILFLYFIEAKGWLGGRPRFLREAVDRCLGARRSLHRDLLDPLFFGTLNRPYEARSRLARHFGPLPFLNGGLFEPHPLERRWRVTLPTPVLRDAFDELFERFHFTLSESSGDAIAPNMLGRVFEGVMAPGERHATGSYYTPAALVEAVLREALAAWLARRLRIPDAQAERRIAEPDSLTRSAFRGLRLLDPAAGSGAFLLGALRLLAGPERGRVRPARLRTVLTTSVYGVDLNPAAVRLAELRLWLEVAAAEGGDPADIAPLPNLDALIRQGDSLMDPVRGIPLPSPPLDLAAELTAVRGALVLAAGPEKAALVRRHARLERRVAETALEEVSARLEGEIAELVTAGRSPTLFGERRGLGREERVRLAELRRRRGRVREQLRAIRRTGAVPWFHYPVQFADVFARAGGGFDLIVGNPPWIRAEALPPAGRRYLAERYRFFRASAGESRGYGHLPDLAVAFLERALELAAPDGVIAFLVPAKLATTGYATTLRAELARTTTVMIAADLRDDPRSAFDGTVYPMALVLGRGAAPPGHRVRLGLSGPGGAVPQRELGAAPWVLVEDTVRTILTRLRMEFPFLGDRFSCQLGVKTGLNRAFLDPPPSVEPELVRFAIRGRDLEPFRVRPRRRLLWPCTPDGRVLGELPPGAASHLAPFHPDLRRRSDGRAAATRPWALFRTRAAASPHRVIWADVARRLTAVPLTGTEHRKLIPLNTCYVIAVPDEATAFRLSAWLNCSWCRALAAVTADPASGGFRRFNARVVAALPCPPAVLGDTALFELGRAGVGDSLAQSDLDERAAVLLSLSPDERRALAALDREGAQSGRRVARAG